MKRRNERPLMRWLMTHPRIIAAMTKVLPLNANVARQTAQPWDRRGKNPDQTDPGDNQTQAQHHPSEARVIVHGQLILCISARKLASDITPSYRAAILPSLKISSAGIEEMP
jgi:hypothetical protein